MGNRPSEHSDRAWHELTAQQALDALHSTPLGLDSEQARARLQQHGANRLPPPQKRGPLLRLLYQFHNVLLYLMLGAALIAALLGHWVDTAVILAAVLINVVIGFIQEGKAENALNAIRDMLSPHAMVRRDGERHEIDAEQLVPGDVVLLVSGDKVPADLRLLSVKNLLVEEAALTGESVPVEKSVAHCRQDAALGDRRCMAYSGTLVSSGQASGLVVATGADTELGRIGAMLQQVQALSTPLLRQIEQFSRWLGRVAGNNVLTLGARGGVYIAGGVVPRFAERFLASGFAKSFSDKGCMSHYLDGIPVWLVTAEYPGLTGAGVALQQAYGAD